MILFYGIMIPFIGTTLGSFMVLFIKEKINQKLEKILLGFSSGVMIAASIWSLIIPALDMTKNQNLKIPWFPVSIGFLFGILILMLIDVVLPYIENKYLTNTEIKAEKNKTKSVKMLILAMILHNIPEGMAVGVAFASVFSGSADISILEAIALSIGIAIQNFPEGAIVSIPLRTKGESKLKALFFGVLSGIVEPIAAIITILLTSIVVPIMPYLLSFAAGCMVYVVVNELIPEFQDETKLSKYGTIGLSLGFIIMMILDTSLGT